MIKRQIIKDNDDKPVGVIIDYNEYMKLKKIEQDVMDSAEAEKAERDYYSSLTMEQRLNIMQELREMIEKFGHESRKGLRSVFKIIKQ